MIVAEENDRMNRKERRLAAKQGPWASPSAAPPNTSPSPGVAGMVASALEHHQAGRVTEAEALYRNALAIEPRNVDGLNYLGLLALQQGRPDEAVKLIGKALTMAPQSPSLHYNLAAACRAVGNLDQAVTHYRRSLQSQPDNPPAHNNLGRVLHQQGKLVESATAYMSALALAEDPHVLCNLGNVRVDQGDLAGAAACYERARHLAPGMAEAHNALGGVLLKQEKIDDAIACFRKSVALRSDMPEAHSNLARALLASGAASTALETTQTKSRTGRHRRRACAVRRMRARRSGGARTRKPFATCSGERSTNNGRDLAILRGSSPARLPVNQRWPRASRARNSFGRAV